MPAMAQKPTPSPVRRPGAMSLSFARNAARSSTAASVRKRKESLKTELRQALRDAGRRRDVRLVETSCLGICPKQGVTALNATSPGTIHIVPAGADRQDVLQTLLGRHVVADLGGVEGA